MNSVELICEQFSNAYKVFDISMVSDAGGCPVKLGVFKQDAFLFWLEKECGIEIHPQKDFVTVMDSFNIVDEHKYMWFLLKWA